MSTARFNTLQDVAGGNSMPVADINQGRAKVWAWLNGTGVIATLDSFGVSSFTDNGAGDYTCNFTTPFANAVYPGFVTGDTQASGFLGATRDGAAPQDDSRMPNGCL